jgi:anti-sigma B factor antagonist
MFTLRNQGAVRVIGGDQSLTVETVDAAAKVCEEALKQGQPRLVFDLQSVGLLDSAGLELLLDICDRCTDRGGALHLAAPNALCRDILRATSVADRFAIFRDTLSAVGSFAQ